MRLTADTADPVFTDTLELDMGTVEPSLAGPKRPQDRVALSKVAEEFCAVLAKEAGPMKIRVNAVRPAFIDTEIHAVSGNPQRAHTLGAQTPLGRAGTAEEVGEAIVWLLSDASSYVSGALIDMAGGR